MKKRSLFIYAAIAVLLLVISVPLIKGMINDAEVLELNDASRARLHGQFIKLKDGWTHYELIGEAKKGSVVLIHGNSSPYFSYDNNVEELVDKGFQVLRYDVFGHGFSDRPEAIYNHILYDRQLENLLDSLGLNQPIHLVGTSQGGAIAAYFTAHHPERVGRLALLAPLMDDFNGKGIVNLLKTPFGSYIKTAFFDGMNVKNCASFFVGDEKIEGFREKYKEQMQFKGWKRAKLANVRDMDLVPIVEAFKIVGSQNRQVLLTWGDQDHAIPETSIQRMRDVLQDEEYQKITGAGHIAHYEFPDTINPILISFFTR